MDVDDDEGTARQGLGGPEHDRSGETIDEAVEKAETGSQVAGVHTPSGQAESGESRIERMVDVEERSTGTRAPESPASRDDAEGAG